MYAFWGVAGLMVLVVAALAGMAAWGGRCLSRAARRPPAQGPWPPVALIVPLKGSRPGLAENLSSLLEQDYPDFELILVTESEDDPACEVIRRVTAGCGHARLVIAGQARDRGQKNHNQLAGVAAAGQRAEVLAFGDGGNRAPAGWLKELLRPVVEQGAGVVSGYHQALPAGSGLPGWGRAVSVLVMFLGKTVPFLDQPWGGAMALTRRAYDELDVAGLWADTVVDDVTLAMRLKQRGAALSLAPGAVLETPLQNETWSGWMDWLHRQWIYLKFCLPGAWVGAGTAALTASALLIWSLIALPLALTGLVASAWGWLAAAYLAALAAESLWLRLLHPARPSAGTWVAAFFLAMGLAAWCHMTNWPAVHIQWGGIRYRVGRRGRVLAVQRPDGEMAAKGGGDERLG